MLRLASILAAALLAATEAGAAGAGCEALAWNLDAERALIASAGPGGATVPPFARRFETKPLAEAALPRAPERARGDPDALAAFVAVTVPEAGLYRVTLDAEGWLDVVQADAFRRADAFTSARDCPGLRKSVRFRLEAGPAVVQVSGVRRPSLGLALTREP